MSMAPMIKITKPAKTIQPDHASCDAISRSPFESPTHRCVHERGRDSSLPPQETPLDLLPGRLVEEVQSVDVDCEPEAPAGPRGRKRAESRGQGRSRGLVEVGGWTSARRVAGEREVSDQLGAQGLRERDIDVETRAVCRRQERSVCQVLRADADDHRTT